MNNVSKTLYIPLYGKATVSRKGIILSDKKAEEIWAAEGFPLRGKARSKWLAYSMAMRAAAFDRWTTERMAENPDALVLHIGCGMDSRADRIGQKNGCHWYDVDFPEVIQERKRYFTESETYRMLPGDARETGWLDALPRAKTAIVVMEGISMYLNFEECTRLLAALRARFARLHLLMDCYTSFGAKASKYKNPINSVGVTQTYGIDDPALLADAAKIQYVQEHPMAPEDLIRQLGGMEQAIFRKLFAGSFASRIYRMYEFSCQTQSDPEEIIEKATKELAAMESLSAANQYLDGLVQQHEDITKVANNLYRLGDVLFNTGLRITMEAHASGLEAANRWGIVSAPERIAYIRLTGGRYCVLITRIPGVSESMPVPCEGMAWSHVRPAGAAQLIADTEKMCERRMINEALLHTQAWHVVPSTGRIVLPDWSRLCQLTGGSGGQRIVEQIKKELFDRGLI